MPRPVVPMLLALLAGGVEQLVERQHEVRAVGDEDPAGRCRCPRSASSSSSPKKVSGSSTTPLPTMQVTPRMQDARRNLAQDEVRVADDDGVAGVGAALVAHDQVGPLGEDVDQLALALVPPLRPDDHHAGGLRVEHVGSPGQTQRKEPLAGLQNPRANVCAGQPTVNSPRAPVPPARAVSSERPSAVSRGVWIVRSVRQVSRPMVTAGTPARANGRLSVRMPSGSRRSRGAKPDAASRGASRPRERGAARVVAHERELALLVDRVEVHDHGARAARGALGRRTRGRPTSPNSSAPVIRMPVAGSSSRFGRGERRGDAGPVVSRPRRSCRGAARGRRARPPSTASRGPAPAERHRHGAAEARQRQRRPAPRPPGR